MNWKKYRFEFLSIFIAVIAAFALNNWNEVRKNNRIENKILIEILHGLEKDTDDIKDNKGGHEGGIAACRYWRNLINSEEVNLDSLARYYSALTRDYISIQNISGYESLKSKGLELVKDDSLRFEIITLYEYDYNVLKKLEEEYQEMQYYKNYFPEINKQIAPNFLYNEKGEIISIKIPLQISTEEKNILLSYLGKIEFNRNFTLKAYVQLEEKIINLKEKIKKHLRQ